MPLWSFPKMDRRNATFDDNLHIASVQRFSTGSGILPITGGTLALPRRSPSGMDSRARLGSIHLLSICQTRSAISSVMIMTTKALLHLNPRPSETEAREALKYNLCRCGAHVEIIRAVMRAAGHTVEGLS